MITRENYKEVLNMISEKDYGRIQDTDKEYIVLSLHQTNSMSWVTIKLTNDFDRYKNVSNYGNVILEAGMVWEDLNHNYLERP